MDESELVTIYSAQGMLSAYVIKGKLESAGIPALLKYESLGPIYGLTVDGLGQVRVQVPADLADQALALIDEDEADLPPTDDEADETPENA